jgi:ABC-2 type transport system ATP-binding protein
MTAANSNGSFAIRLSRVTKTYGDITAVGDFDLAIPAGSVYGFLGPNGSGKTTTLRMILGILLPDSGQISVLGQSPGSGVRNRIGYLPEERGLYPKMKVAEVLQFFGELNGGRAAEIRQAVARWLQRLELADWANRRVNELSKGMQQKVQFIVSVICNPDVLILDEPSSGLDPISANVLKDVLLELRAAGKTILFSTHRMEDAERLCDYVCLIHHGRKVLDGHLDQVRSSGGSLAARVDYAGDSGLLRQAPGVTDVNDYGRYAELRLQAGVEPAALLRWLSQRLEVGRFEVLNPSLNQIFLEAVGAPENQHVQSQATGRHS